MSEQKKAARSLARIAGIVAIRSPLHYKTYGVAHSWYAKVQTLKEDMTLICPICQSNNIKKNGPNRGKQNHYCKDCGRQFIDSYS